MRPLKFVQIRASEKPEDKNKAVSEFARKGDLEQVRRLLDSGADVNAKGPADSTLLMAAAAQGQLEMVKLLLEKGANPSAKDTNGKTAVAYADEKGFSEVKDFLQEKMSPATREPRRKEKKKVSTDQPEPGKHRLGAMSPGSNPTTQTNPQTP